MTTIRPIKDGFGGYTGRYVDIDNGHTYNGRQDVIDALGYNPFEGKKFVSCSACCGTGIKEVEE